MTARVIAGGPAPASSLAQRGHVAAAWARSRLSTLAAPTAVDQLPDVRRALVRSTRTLAWTNFGMTVLVGALYHVARLDVAGPPLPVLTAFLVIQGALAWAAHRSDGGLHAERINFGTAVLAIVQITCAGLATAARANPLLAYIPSIPLVFGLSVAWRPSWSLAVGAAGVAIPTLAALLSPDRAPMPGTDVLVMTVAFALVVAVTNHQQRRRWLELERARRQLVAQDRLCSIGRMTAGLAHELKTPIAAAMNGIESASSLTREMEASLGHPDVKEEDLREITAELHQALGIVGRSASRAARYVGAIRAHTQHLNNAAQETFALDRAVDGALLLLAHRTRKSRASVTTELPPTPVWLTGDRVKLEQVVSNLVLNAVEAIEESGEGAEVRVLVTDDAHGVTLAVEDDGPGVPEAFRPRVFEPMVTTRAQGTGLGLWICKDLVEASFGGRLHLADRPDGGRGARFEVLLAQTGAAWATPAFLPGHTAAVAASARLAG